MNPYQFSDQYISGREFSVALPSVIIGVSILDLPRTVASVTSYSDGWIPILVMGIVFTLFALLAVKVASYFPDQSFVSYTSYLLSRPVAIVFSFVTMFLLIAISSLATRSLAYISQQYLFEKTPMEALALCFILVVTYAISGERAGIFRLNMLFLPIILVVFIFVALFNMKWYDASNYLPLFKTSAKGYAKGILNTFGSYTGFGIGLFYTFLVRNPKKITKGVVAGMSVTIIFYLFIFLASIGVYGNLATSNLQFPTIELAKRVDIPGGIFERIDAFIFSIWIMAIFNTVTIMLDITLLLFCSIFKKANKKIIAFILAPIVFYISMFPQQTDEVDQWASVLSIVSVSFICFVIVSLFLVAKIKEVDKVE